ncbi:NAD(P)/FAD-dependent oxidoreductase [Radicibacter daui]|uniref:NAD(P)/FAD-dependent oxidoreductase n=1 Tax=Radicibacter daui TaxID=3064829 RepID=UPI004046AD5D
MGKQPAVKSVHIVGGGIVGLNCALALTRRGYAVTLIERNEPGSGTSRGNAAGIAWTDVTPLASPGIWKSLPGWLMDPLGPLAIRPAYLPNLAGWMLRFLWASRPAQVERSITAIAALNGAALPAWETVWEEAGLLRRVKRDGCLDVFEDARVMAAHQAEYALQRRHGIQIEMLDGDGVHDMEPELAPHIAGGAFLPGWVQVDDPHGVCLDLAAHLRGRGVRFAKVNILRVERRGKNWQGPVLVTDDGRELEAERVIIAAGAWSKPLAASLGDEVPLDTERGYNITVPNPGIAIRRFMMLYGHGFVLSPLATGLRIGGAVEFGGLKAEPDWRRVDAMIAKAKRLLPGLDASEGARWMGFRPSLPDSLPVIGPASEGEGKLFYAFGHAHHGLTQSAITGEMIADMVEDRTPTVDPAPYRAQRFAFSN